MSLVGLLSFDIYGSGWETNWEGKNGKKRI